MPVLPHQTQPSIGTAASLALCATLPLSTRPQEFTGPRPDLDELFKEPLEFKHGEITLRDRPGLGLGSTRRRWRRRSFHRGGLGVLSCGAPISRGGLVWSSD